MRLDKSKESVDLELKLCLRLKWVINSPASKAVVVLAPKEVN